MWRCPHCGRVHYVANRTMCDCPKSMEQNDLAKMFDSFFNDCKCEPKPKETTRNLLGIGPSLNDVYEEVIEPNQSREDASELAYLEKLDKEEKRGDNGGLDAMIEDLFEQQDSADLNELIEETIEEQRRKDDLEVRSVVETFEKEARKQTLVVNLFAGPGAGKSTTAAGLFFELKSRGINCELAAEYAKDLTWEERHRTFQNQVYIFGKQHHRIFRLLGQVEVVITDSPLLLSVVYDGEKRETLKQLVYEEHRKMWTYNVFIKRMKKFNPKGRVHDLEESRALDNMILDALDDAGECYEVFDGTPDGLTKIVHKVLGHLAYHKSLKK